MSTYSMKPQLNATQKAITKKIRTLVPDATAIIFHGSRVRGMPSPTSDYVVMVFTPTGMELEDREVIKEELRSAFPDLEIDPVFGTERYFIAHLAVYPDDRYTIREVLLYHEQAAKIAKMRTWNETEVAYLRERTIRNAGNFTESNPC
jgi:predicted nucleotidyltransferase